MSKPEEVNLSPDIQRPSCSPHNLAESKPVRLTEADVVSTGFLTVSQGAAGRLNFVRRP